MKTSNYCLMLFKPVNFFYVFLKAIIIAGSFGSGERSTFPFSLPVNQNVLKSPKTTMDWMKHRRKNWERP